MNDHDDSSLFRELIPAYLKNELSAQQLGDFEAALAGDDDLRQEMQDAAHLYVGIMVADKIDAGHIDAEQLAIYGTQPEELGDETRQEINEHLKVCADCSAELKLCRLADTEPNESPATARGLFGRFLDLFMLRQAGLRQAGLRQVGFRPVLTYTVVLLVAVATSYRVGLFQATDGEIPSFALSSRQFRGQEDRNLIEINKDQAVIEMRLTLPTREGSVYTFEIIDAHGASVLMYPGRLHQIPFALLVPSDYLTDGTYTIRAVEESALEETERKPDTILVEVDVNVID